MYDLILELMGEAQFILPSFLFVCKVFMEKFIQIGPWCFLFFVFSFWIVELILDWFVRGYVGLKLFKLKQDQAPSLKRSTHSFNILVPKCVSVHTSYQEKLYNYTTQ